MSRPSFVLRGPGDLIGDILFIDRDGKETALSLYEVLILVGEGALIAQLSMPAKKHDTVVPLRPSAPLTP